MTDLLWAPRLLMCFYRSPSQCFIMGLVDHSLIQTLPLTTVSLLWLVGLVPGSELLSNFRFYNNVFLMRSGWKNCLFNFVVKQENLCIYYSFNIDWINLMTGHWVKLSVILSRSHTNHPGSSGHGDHRRGEHCIALPDLLWPCSGSFILLGLQWAAPQ